MSRKINPSFSFRGQRITSLRQIPSHLKSPKMIGAIVGFARKGKGIYDRVNSFWKKKGRKK